MVDQVEKSDKKLLGSGETSEINDGRKETREEKQLEANYIISKKVLNEFRTNDYSKEGHEKSQYEKVTWESYKRYFEEHKQDLLNRYEEVRTPDGDIIRKPKRVEEVGDEDRYKKEEDNQEIDLIWDKDWDNYKISERKWLIQDLIPAEGIGIWTGKRGSFKTFLLMNASYCIAKGLDFLGKYKTTQGKVIYLDRENGAGIMKERCGLIKKGMNIDEADVGFICHSQIKMDINLDAWKIEDLIEKEKPSLLVIDTFRRVVSFDENDAGNVSRFFIDILQPLVDKYKPLTIILIHHDRKGNGGNGDEMDEIRGSSDLANYCHFILKNQRKGKNIVLKQLKLKHAIECNPIPISVSTDETNFINFETGNDILPKTQLQKCTELLMVWFKQKQIVNFTTAEAQKIAFNEGIKATTFKEALNDLQSLGVIEKVSDRGKYKVIDDVGGGFTDNN